MYSQLLPSASSLVRNQANISLRVLADSVSNVKLCVGGGVKYCLSSTHASNLASLCNTKSFVTLRYKKLFHSVIQKFQNLVSLCDTKHFKQSFKVSSLNFTQALHHSIHLVIQNFRTLSYSVIQIQYILAYPNSTAQVNFVFCLDN